MAVVASQVTAVIQHDVVGGIAVFVYDSERAVFEGDIVVVRYLFVGVFIVYADVGNDVRRTAYALLSACDGCGYIVPRNESDVLVFVKFRASKQLSFENRRFVAYDFRTACGDGDFALEDRERARALIGYIVIFRCVESLLVKDSKVFFVDRYRFTADTHERAHRIAIEGVPLGKRAVDYLNCG